jgi:hypothetical protein
MLRKYSESVVAHKVTGPQRAEIARQMSHTTQRYWFGDVPGLFDSREGSSRRSPASAGPFEGRK